jgi:protocatechuate 3,4-dioxygenase beta subunit
MSVHDSVPARTALALVLATTLAACGSSVPPAALDGEGSSGAPDTITFALEDEADAPSAAASSSGADASETLEDDSQAAAEAGEPVDATGDGAVASTDASIDEVAAALPAPSCADLAPTPFDAEGPFYTADTPERDDLREPGDPGTALRVVGYVLDSDCRTLPGAKIDVWQTDDAGDYDNEGYGYRGHLFTDEAGAYAFTTILPGTYPGRPRHIHLRVHAPDDTDPTLTSQLYFRLPDGTDDTAGVDPALVVDLEDDPEAGGLAGRFDFVLETE